jgi:cytoskeletal protein RodZ
MTDATMTDIYGDERSVGQQLREARERLGLTYRELAAITKIQAHFLACLEEERFDEFPAEAFTRGFLRSYARELRLDEADVMAAYDRQRGRPTQARPSITVPSPSVVDRSASTSTAAGTAAGEVPRIARVAYAAAVAVLVVLLAGAVLIFGSSDDEGASTATFAPDSQLDTWRPAAPQGLDDWRTLREN